MFNLAQRHLHVRETVSSNAGKPLPKLMLPPGRIRYEVEDATAQGG